MTPMQKEIEHILKRELDPSYLVIVDESDQHIGHKEARGGGHYQVKIVSKKFEGQNLLQRHRTVYALLQNEMKRNIHALQLSTLTPEEWRKHTEA